MAAVDWIVARVMSQAWLVDLVDTSYAKISVAYRPIVPIHMRDNYKKVDIRWIFIACVPARSNWIPSPEANLDLISLGYHVRW